MIISLYSLISRFQSVYTYMRCNQVGVNELRACTPTTKSVLTTVVYP